MNVHEQNYIQGFMIEYESKAREDAQKAEQKRVDEVTTENTKKLVFGKSLSPKEYGRKSLGKLTQDILVQLQIFKEQ